MSLVHAILGIRAWSNLSVVGGLRRSHGPDDDHGRVRLRRSQHGDRGPDALLVDRSLRAFLIAEVIVGACLRRFCRFVTDVHDMVLTEGAGFRAPVYVGPYFTCPGRR